MRHDLPKIPFAFVRNDPWVLLDMKNPTFFLGLLSVLLFSATPVWSQQTWNYYVIHIGDAVAPILEAENNTAFEEWLQTNRPEVFSQWKETQDQKDSADNTRKKLKVLVSDVTSRDYSTFAALDYFLNLKGAEGWELVTIHDNRLILKR